MTRTVRSVIVLAFVAAIALAVLPATAEINGSYLASVNPGNVTSGETFDISFDVYVTSSDLDYMDRFDIDLPSSWSINSITPNAGTSCGVDGIALISGQDLIWQDPMLDDGCGPWVRYATHTFTANVTVNSCVGAPWNLPWHISSDEWGSPPYDVYGNYAIGCDDVVAEPQPGCDALINIPDSAVGATVLSDAQVYWRPGQVTEHVLPAGTTLRAIGVDASGEYYQVLYVCDFLWVQAGTLGPNHDAVWNGAPLPTAVIEVDSGASSK